MRYNAGEKEDIQRGSMKVLLDVLRREEKDVVDVLKLTKDDSKYFQGSVNTLDDIISLIGTLN